MEIEKFIPFPWVIQEGTEMYHTTQLRDGKSHPKKVNEPFCKFLLLFFFQSYILAPIQVHTLGRH